MIKNYACLFIILLILINPTSYAQENPALDSIFSAFTTYTQPPREIAYAHLNKSVYIDGETMAFTVYTFDKGVKRFSTRTRNVYCSITDDKGNVIKSQMLLAVNGVCDGSFFIDNLLSEGNYTFKAYTNYMKNFEEMNYYVQNFRVVTAEGGNENENSSEIDAQFLPEGGHLVAGVINYLGVIIKDREGLGIADISGEILDKDGIVVAQFNTDQFGLGRLILKTEKNNSYHAQFSHSGETHKVQLPIPEHIGIAMNLLEVNDRIALQIKTNAETFSNIQSKPFYLTFHNGKELRSIPVSFEDEMEVAKLINKDYLFPGVNVFTLFNSELKPVSERVFFNYKNINISDAPSVKVSRIQDSISISLELPEPPNMEVQNYSISVLPEATESYLHSHNILSYTFLQPYIKGYLENAAYYFTDIDLKKQRQLDNVLITQGWSSYDWNNLFNIKPEYNFNFEDGIAITANLYDNSFASYSVSSSNTNFTIIEIEEGQDKFTILNNYPFKMDNVYISGLTKKGKTRQPKLALQYFPSKIPEFDNYVKIIPRRKPNIVKDIGFQDILETSWTDFQQLDEVVLNVKKRQSRIEEITSNENGQVDIFDNQKSYAYLNFGMYLRSKGFQVEDRQGEFLVTIPGRSRGSNISPVFLLNNLRLTDPTILNQIDMNIVDYVVIDKNAINVQGASGAGVIKIYTDPTKNIVDNSYRSTSLMLNYPLTFTGSKKFYAPKYSFYQSSFFNSYGVIDWIPQAKADENGVFKFTFADRGYKSVVLKIEGSNDGEFMSESLVVEIPEKS